MFVLLMLNLLYGVTLFNADLKVKSPELWDIKKNLHQADVFYFGESSDQTYSPNDSVKLKISALTSLFFPGIKLVAIDKSASHAGIYKYWISTMISFKQRPKAIIVTLNLRSFGAAWIHSKLETQLQESTVLARPYPNILNRFALALQVYDHKSESLRNEETMLAWKTTKLLPAGELKYATTHQWDSAMAKGTYLKSDGSWDLQKIDLACNYIKNYAFNINESNPRLMDFDEIAACCAKNNIPLYLNLMAENVEYADSLVGKELVFLMHKNRNFLVERYNKGNCRVVDNLELVSGREFIDQNWTTEHYTQRGRMKIARNLALSLREQFRNNFKEVK